MQWCGSVQFEIWTERMMVYFVCLDIEMRNKEKNTIVHWKHYVFSSMLFDFGWGLFKIFSMNSFYFSYQDFKHKIQSQHSKWKKSIFRISEKKFWSFWEMHQNAKIKCLNDRSRKQIISYQTTDPLVQNPTQYIKQREFQANEGKE